MFLRKARAGSAPGYTWHTAGEVLEVPDDFAVELLAIPDGGFTQVAPPEPEPVPEDNPELLPNPEKAEGSEPPAPELTPGQKAAATRAANKAAQQPGEAKE